MLNTFLNLVNMKVQYDRGYSAGLPGLFSLVLIGFIIYFFEPIYRFLDFIGFIGFLKNTGIIHPYDGAMTIWRLVVAAGIIVLFVTIGLALLITIANFAPFLAYLLIPLIFILAGPILLFGVIHNKVTRQSTIKLCLLKGWKEGKAKEISIDETDKILDRFPTLDDNFFYMAMTRNKDVYALVPLPKSMNIFREDHLWGFPVKYPKDDRLSILNPVPLFDGEYPRPVNKREILYVIENRSDVFLEFYKYLRNEKYIYSDYVFDTRKEYECRKRELLEEWEYEKKQYGVCFETDQIRAQYNRLTEIERRDTSIFKEGWVYERKL